jgi:hypothetical protein
MNYKMGEDLVHVQGWIKKDILEKLDQIKSKVIKDCENVSYEKIQFLAIVNDELDEVLLNWEGRAF